MATQTKPARQLTPAQTLERACARFDAENQEWIASDRHSPAPEWWEKMAEVLDAATAPEALEPWEFRTATALVDAYLQSTRPDGRPTASLLRCYHEFRTLKPPAQRPTETPLELLTLPGMSLEQVAKMLGVPLKRVHQMQAELVKKKNGDPYDKTVLELPAGHQTPEERERQSRMIQDAKLWRSAISRWQTRPTIGMEAEDGWVPPPESVEELLSLPGMSLEQVAHMHRLTPEQAAAIRDGRPIPQAAPPAESEGSQPETYPDDLHSDLPPEVVTAEINALRAEEPSLSDHEVAERLGVGLAAVQAAKPAKPSKRRK